MEVITGISEVLISLSELQETRNFMSEAKGLSTILLKTSLEMMRYLYSLHALHFPDDCFLQNKLENWMNKVFSKDSVNRLCDKSLEPKQEIVWISKSVSASICNLSRIYREKNQLLIFSKFCAFLWKMSHNGDFAREQLASSLSVKSLNEFEIYLANRKSKRSVSGSNLMKGKAFLKTILLNSWWKFWKTFGKLLSLHCPIFFTIKILDGCMEAIPHGSF